MRKRWVVVAVVAVVMVAQPAAAANASAVASEHTTFGTGSAGEPAPTKTTNMTVKGSGESASVVLDSGFSTIDSFEDGDISEYGGDTGNFSVVSDSTGPAAPDGSQKLQANDPGGVKNTIVNTGTTVSQGGTFDARVYPAGEATFVFGAQAETGTDSLSGYAIEIVDTANAFRISRFDNGGRTVLIDGTASISGSEWHRVEVNWYTNDTIEATLYDSTGSQIGQVSASDSTYTSGGYGFQVFDSTVYWDNFRKDVGARESGQYLGATHNAEDINSGFANVTLQNASATLTWQEDGDGDGTWTNVTSTTYTSGGNKTVDLSTTTSDRWRLRVDINKTGSSPVAEIHDEGLLFASSSPTLSNPDPADGAKINKYDGDISIDLSDTDFGLSQGDAVTVTATNASGGQIGSQSLTANGTVTFTYDALAGKNTITWTASDGYGNTDTFTQTFTTPGQLTLKNISDQSTITSSADATVQLFRRNNDIVITRSASNGQISLGGLPAAATYVVRVEANGYKTRRTLLQDIFQQQSVYLLPDSATTHVVEFSIEDRTGTFDSSAELQILRPINTSATASDETEYQIVAGDRIGSQKQVKVTLEDSVRYRIRISSADGSTVRTLGAFVPRSNRVVNLKIGDLQFRVGDGAQTFNTSTEVLKNSTGSVTDVRFAYRDPADQTSRINISVQTLNGTVLGNDTQAGPIGNYSFTQPVPPKFANNTSFVVKYEITRNGNTIRGQSRPGLNRYRAGVPLAPGLKQLFSVGFLLVVGGLFSSQNARVGAVITPLFAGGLWYFDWLPPETSVLAIALALGVGVLVNFAERRS